MVLVVNYPWEKMTEIMKIKNDFKKGHFYNGIQAALAEWEIQTSLRNALCLPE